VEKDVSPEKASLVNFLSEYWELPAARAGREIGNDLPGNPSQARNPRTKRSFSGRLNSSCTARRLITQKSPLSIWTGLSARKK
jgi:hypothetical protein